MSEVLVFIKVYRLGALKWTTEVPLDPGPALKSTPHWGG